MCGFVTVSSACPLGRADYARLERATQLLRHRGPDDEGYLALSATSTRFRGRDTIAALSHLPFVSTEVQPAVAAMGFRRLSILDLSAAGHQPMVDPLSGHALAFNGEIYNYQELRETLPGPFLSGSDTEVLLRAGSIWGEEALPRLNGMFGFALWDPASQSLLLARDRFGEKQVYLRSLGLSPVRPRRPHRADLLSGRSPTPARAFRPRSRRPSAIAPPLVPHPPSARRRSHPTRPPSGRVRSPPAPE
jgi:asparagine synthase (glutamine-hydrolysing)